MEEHKIAGKSVPICKQTEPINDRKDSRGDNPYQNSGTNLFSHCMLHKQALVKKMHTSLKGVLDEDVKIVNHFKSMPFNARLFKIFCKGMGSEYKALLLHTEVRWLPREKCLLQFLSFNKKVLLSFYSIQLICQTV